MNENLFNETAKLQADRNQVEGQRELASGPSGSAELEIGRLSRQLLTFGAALLVNLAVLGILEWSAYAARPVPEGQVVITQLNTDSQVRIASN